MSKCIVTTWSNLKSLISSKKLLLQYSEPHFRYYIFALDADVEYATSLWTDTSQVVGINIEQNNIDLADFEANYKTAANKSLVLKDSEGKQFVRAESRPVDCTTYFTAAGDITGDIGGGKSLAWDFSNDDDLVTAPSGYKRKRIDYQFIDTIYLKEGTIYFHNAVKGSYLDQSIVCPTGYYYYKNDGSIAQAASDTVIAHYVNKHPLQGSCPMGDELNTETCSSAIPSYYKFRLEITVPDTDSTSNGCTEAEIYRVRTVVLA